MRALIVTGGFVDDRFTLDYIRRETYDIAIAVDRGLGFFQRTGLRPDYIVGDFDSVEDSVLDFYVESAEKTERPQIIRLNPMKDDTDTEHALCMALDMGCDSIHIFGATGTRLDHVLGNLQLLGYALRQQKECMLIDPHNRIRLIDHETLLRKEEQFGSYVSLIPYTPTVTGLTLTGFVYPLHKHTMSSFYMEGASNISGISNEIDKPEAVISLESGILVLVEARD